MYQVYILYVLREFFGGVIYLLPLSPFFFLPLHQIKSGKIRISTFLEDVPDAKIPLSHNSKQETGMVGLKNQVITLKGVTHTAVELTSLSTTLFKNVRTACMLILNPNGAYV